MIQEGSDVMLDEAQSKNPSSGRRSTKGSAKVKYDPSKTSIKNVKPIKGTRATNVNANIGPKKGK